MRSLLVLLLLSAAPMAAQAPVRALTFNIRFGTAADGEHAWPNRRAGLLWPSDHFAVWAVLHRQYP